MITCLGVEIMSKGKKKDFTAAQKASLDGLLEACGVAAKWPELRLRLLFVILGIRIGLSGRLIFCMNSLKLIAG
jgi:hypothetical protein